MDKKNEGGAGRCKVNIKEILRDEQLKQRLLEGAVRFICEFDRDCERHNREQVVWDEEWNNLVKDVQRYRWLKAQKSLDLRSERTFGTPWTHGETGRKYYPSHFLAVSGTGYSGIEHLDDAIDMAMEHYPLEGGNNIQEQPFLQPIPLSERKPEPEEMDGTLVWCGSKAPGLPYWEWCLDDIHGFCSSGYTHWLPASTKYLPAIMEG